jgi:hypothetical protein
MNRYSGVLGIRQDAIETSPGVWEAPILEVSVKGEIFRKSLRWSVGNSAQDKLQANQVIRVVIPQTVVDNLDKLIYATFEGRKWAIRGIEYERPNLEASLGGVYNA